MPVEETSSKAVGEKGKEEKKDDNFAWRGKKKKRKIKKCISVSHLVLQEILAMFFIIITDHVCGVEMGMVGLEMHKMWEGSLASLFINNIMKGFSCYIL